MVVVVDVVVIEVEAVQVLVDQLGKDLLLHPVVDPARVAVHENVFLSTVAVQIANEEDVSVLLKLFDHVFHVVDRWVELP